MSDASTPTHPAAVRLIFEYDGDEVRLLAQQPVDVAVTGFDLPRVQRAGLYAETRNAAGDPMSRVPLRDAFAGSAEVFPEQPGQPITRIDVPRRGAFTVIVPAPAAAAEVALIRVAARPSAPGGGPGGPAAARATGPAPDVVEHDVTDIATFRIER